MVYDSIIRQTILDAQNRKEIEKAIRKYWRPFEIEEIEAHSLDFSDLEGYGLKQDESGEYNINSENDY